MHIMKNSKFFKDKVIIITGASSGIGRKAAYVLAGFGAKVVLAARSENKLNEAVQEITRSGGRAMAVKTDVSNYEDAANLIKQTIDKWNQIDILIANAGQYIQGRIKDIEIDVFKQSMAVNFYGAVYLVKNALPAMLARGSGQIVIINSLGAKKGLYGDGAYASAKSALDGFGEVLRQELKSSGVGVTSVYPGRVDTPMIEHLKVPWISAKISIDKAVRAVIRGIKQKKPMVIVPLSLYMIGALNNIFPRLLDWLYMKFGIEGRSIE